jgi:hypothetical protein
MSQAQIQTSAQVTTPEKYMNTAAVSCNKRHNIFTFRTLHFKLDGIFGNFLLILISSNSTTSFLLGIFEKKDVTCFPKYQKEQQTTIA